MHIIESYSSNARARISRPILVPKFFPVPFEKYITIQGDTKFNSRKYDWFPDTLALLKPFLNDIKIIQIGGQNDRPINGVDLNLCGLTNFRQTYHVIQNSLLHIGADSVNIHIASVFNVPIVGLYSNMFISHSKPYFSDESAMRLLQAPLNGNKPSYSVEEHPKIINLIRPEQIVKASLELLHRNQAVSRESIYFGKHYSSVFLESVTDSLIDPKFIPELPITARFDYVNLNQSTQEFLYNQIYLRKCVVITDKELDIKHLERLKHNIVQIVIKIKNKNQVPIASSIQKLGIPYALVSELEDEALNALKLDYCDFVPIIKEIKPDIKKLIESGKLTEETYFKTNKPLFSNKKIYGSKAHWLEGVASEHPFVPQKIGKFINNEDFLNEIEFMYLYNE